MIVWAWAGTAAAHATTGSIIGIAETICTQFSYDDGEPMGYAKATVLAPGSDQPFQSGATDRNGRFCLIPDGPGTWQITANDGMGHQHKVTATVNETGDKPAVETAATAPVSGHGDRRSRILAGLGLIFGLTGMIGWYRARRQPPGSPSP